MNDEMSDAQKTLAALWAEHVKDEFAAKDVDATLATMVPDAYVNHIPVMTGGIGQDALREFYETRFIPRCPLTPRFCPCRRRSAPTSSSTR